MTDDMRNTVMYVLADLIGFPTVTSEPNLDLIRYADEHLRRAGAITTVTYDEHDRGKANLFATIGPNVDGGVVLSGHTDVVPAEEDDWTGAPFLAVRRDERIFGRGSADMKGFIACALAMAPTFASAPLRRPVHIALSFDEEVGCRGAPILIREFRRTGPRPAAAVIGEPTGMEIISAHKGCYEYTTTITGVEGHGSAPGSAVNAVEYGARFISRLLEIGRELEGRPPADEKYHPPHSTISVGRIDGGTARNVVAGQCSIEWEMRPVQRGDAEYALGEIEEHRAELVRAMQVVDPSATIVTETVGAVDGLDHVDGSAAVELMKTLTGRHQVGVVSFGTEAGLFQQAGVPSVVCGPGSIEQAHRSNEYVSLDQLEQCLEAMHRLCDHLASESDSVV